MTSQDTSFAWRLHLCRMTYDSPRRSRCETDLFLEPHASPQVAKGSPDRSRPIKMRGNLVRKFSRKIPPGVDWRQHHDEESESEESSLSSNGADKEESSAGAAREEVERLALKETKDVWTWKFFVMLIILSTAGFMSAAAYKFLEISESDDFRDSVCSKYHQSFAYATISV